MFGTALVLSTSIIKHICYIINWWTDLKQPKTSERCHSCIVSETDLLRPRTSGRYHIGYACRWIGTKASAIIILTRLTLYGSMNTITQQPHGNKILCTEESPRKGTKSGFTAIFGAILPESWVSVVQAIEYGRDLLYIVLFCFITMVSGFTWCFVVSSTYRYISRLLRWKARMMI